MFQMHECSQVIDSIVVMLLAAETHRNLFASVIMAVNS